MRTERSIPNVGKIEVRSTEKGHRLQGYAAVWGAESAPLPYIETPMPGCFVRSLANPPNGRQLVVIDHDESKLLGSTKTGRAAIFEDSTGLGYDVEVPDTTYGRDLRELAEVDELNGSSFEFSATRAGAPFSSDGKRRTLKEVRLYHVTVLTGKTPAYSATTSAIRALAHQANADYEDVSIVLDAVREGRHLEDEEWKTLLRLARAVAPHEGRWSSAADDAAGASYAVSTLLYLLGNETDDASQSTHLKTAIAEVQAFISEESAEIGTDADLVASRARAKLAEARALFPETTTATV